MTCVIDISLLQFGQLSIVGTTEHARLVLMTLPFARQNVAASKRLTLDRVPVSLKSKSWNWLGRFGLDHQYYCAPIIHKSRAEKKQVTTLVGCLATQQLPSNNHFVICGPKLATGETKSSQSRTLSSVSVGLEATGYSVTNTYRLGVGQCQSEILSLKKAVWRLWLVSKSRTKSFAADCEQLLSWAASVARLPSSPSHARTVLSRTICGRTDHAAIGPPRCSDCKKQ